MMLAIFGGGQVLPAYTPSSQPKRKLPEDVAPEPEPGPRTCPVCGHSFKVKPYRKRAGYGITCSRTCRDMDRDATVGANTRMAILAAMATDGLIAREIAEAAGLCAITVSRHLRAMAADGLVERAHQERVDSLGRIRVSGGWRVARSEAAE